MSHAPLFCLRSLWANGGAPAAFVRRDAALAESLARAVQPAAAAPLGNADVFASLLANIDLNAAFGAAADEIARDVDAATSAFAPRRTGPTAPAPHVTTDASTHAPAETHAAAPGRTALPGLHEPAHTPGSVTRAHDDVSPAERAGAVVPGTAAITPHGATPQVHAQMSVNDPPAHLHEQRAALAPEAVATRRWRDAGAMTERHSPAQAGTIAAVLARIDAAGLSRPGSGGPAQEMKDTSARTTISAALANAVQRIEQQRAHAAPPSRTLARDSSAQPSEIHASARFRRATSTTFPDAPAPRAFASPRPPEETMTPRTAGLRGLVERTAIERAAFFGAAAEPAEQVWQPPEFDRMSALLDDAARREGVVLEEGGS